MSWRCCTKRARIGICRSAMEQPASPQPNSAAKEPDTASKPLGEPDQPGKIIVSMLKDYWSKNEGKKKKCTLVFGTLAKKNKTHEALLNAAKTFPDTGNKRKYTHTDSRPFPPRHSKLVDLPHGLAPLSWRRR